MLALTCLVKLTASLHDPYANSNKKQKNTSKSKNKQTTNPNPNSTAPATPNFWTTNPIPRLTPITDQDEYGGACSLLLLLSSIEEETVFPSADDDNNKNNNNNYNPAPKIPAAELEELELVTLIVTETLLLQQLVLPIWNWMRCTATTSMEILAPTFMVELVMYKTCVGNPITKGWYPTSL